MYSRWNSNQRSVSRVRCTTAMVCWSTYVI